MKQTNENTNNAGTSAKPFHTDKAKWQWDSAMEYYCKRLDKNPDSLTDEDEVIIWECAGNHMAFFLTWLIRHDFLGEIHLEAEEAPAIEAVKQKTMTGAAFFSQYCDMVLCREDMAACILPFVDAYYETNYSKDYCNYMQEKTLETPFSWEDYEAFEPILDKRYAAYCQAHH
ncbi:MAG: hypothetical protein Q4D37_00480 [Oscillospiraceae bacterium]|nr:hypothetical protein [Oscillospiraceae bacterium]